MTVRNDSADVLIVGGGVMGAAAAYHLAKDGRRVVLLEQFTIGHSYGSSHGPSRIIRLAYDGADYVALARASFALWRALEAEAGETLLFKVGGLDFGAPDAHHLAGIRATYEALDIPFEALDRDEIQRRFPQFRLPEETIGYYQADYSLLAADRCVATLVAEARRHGARIVEGEVAQRVEVDGGGVVVTTGAATYRSDRLILSAGSWMLPLLHQLGLDLPLTVTKELLTYYQAPDPARYAPGRFPLFIHRFPQTTSLGSGFPIFGHPGVKCMLDRTGPIVPADDPDRSVDDGQLALARAYIADILPELRTVIDTVTCRYTMTPDEDFILDRHPAYSQIVIASPCSGHGFKFGVVIGRILADLATQGATSYPIDRFRLARPALAATTTRSL